MHPEWQVLLPDARSLLEHLERELPNEYVPAADLVMRAFEVSPDAIRVVILGQDPYHGPGQANGIRPRRPRPQHCSSC